MIVIYSPDEGEQQRWLFSPRTLMAVEAEAIERVTGLTFMEFGQALVRGSMAALRALVWVLLKRQEPTLKFADVDFPIGAVTTELDDDERAKAAERIRADPDLDDEDKAAALTSLGVDPADAGDVDGDEVPAGPKAPESSAAGD